MKLTRLLLILIIGFSFSPVRSQHEHDEHCSGLKSWQGLNADTYVADPALLNYDVIFYYIDLEANDTSTYIEGFTEMQAVAVSGILSEIVIELSAVFIIDSILIEGSRVDNFTQAGDIIRINPDETFLTSTQNLS